MPQLFYRMLAGALLLFTSSFTILAQDNVEGGETSESILQREQFMLERRAGGPGKVLPLDAYARAMEQKSQILDARFIQGNPFRVANWITANPQGLFYNRTGANYISGRTNAIAFHPTDINIFYIAAAQGGVWKTTNGGANFVPLTDGLSSLASGDVCVDPNNPNVLYYATGELNYSGDSQYGNGIFKSINAGATWTQVATTVQVGTRFSQIVVDPSNSNVVYAGGSFGVIKSTDAGTTWVVLGTGTNVNCVILHPSNSQIIYMSAGGSGSNTINKSTNGGTSWITLSAGLPGGRGRTQLAISPSNPLVIYASIAATVSGSLLGLYKTIDGGNTWTLQTSSPNYLSGQGWYDNAVVVKPTDENFVVVGGLDAYSSSNGGVTLTQRSSWSTTNSNNMTHADIHAFKYRGAVLYCCSDGGLYKSTNDGVTWTDLNRTISTLQYQSADYDPTASIKIHGGTQDNNKEYTLDGGANWIQLTTGDGGYTVIDPVTPNYIYGAYVNGSMQRSTNSGTSYSEISPSGSVGGLFYNPYELAPGDHLTAVYVQSDVWKTSNVQTVTSGSGWTRIADTLTISGGGNRINISAIGISTQTTSKIYIGTSNGRILVTTNNGTNWQTTTGFVYVSDFAVDNVNDNICYSTHGGSSGTHVFKTTNGGINWTNITGNLPNIAANSIILKTTGARMLVVGMDAGAYYSTNEGANWIGINSGLPAVEIYDLKYHEPAGMLLAATHGRGCWTLDLNSVIGIINYGNEIPKSFTLQQNYPNPFNPQTKFKFGIPADKNIGVVKIAVYDALGKEVQLLVNSQLQAGTYEYQWDGTNYPSGIYYYKMTTSNYSETKKMVLVK